ncbi:hypothetical protein IMX26_16840 [Clostridium sp. 'deep sea']|uniref:PEP/pyruvate-binding domain-containing protein n=1 Tax=Clostridium sp. 'deep sea' TaxID=2779445 RepID=UPI001896826B|nr:PEP/pyruvate-binding domain-containing protein [Clostridium sp. 'deep sea']QOR35102.1 hypothetical protein IMX26_16840 [Clostridium sp. 'deep sea']
MIKWFKDIKETDLLLVGGKGHNLSRMFKHGIDVPNGFVIESSAYDNYVTQHNLHQLINEILRKNNCLVASQKIKQLFTVQKLSQSFVSIVKHEFSKISSGRVAVRSSSTMEDLPDSSFAGQYSSYLNVTKDSLIERIINCWQSLWNERAIEYRKKYCPKQDFSHAVVVQEMINSTTSGVAFTANPITGVRHEVVVNAAFGLGEAVVSGEVNPDQFILNKKNKQISKKELAKKLIKYVYASSGIKQCTLSELESQKASLTEQQLMQLLEVCVKTEKYFKKPQDIEFAFNDNELYIIQSRDITSLYPINNLEQDGKLRAYLGVGTVLLGMKEPFTPFGYDIISLMFPTVINVMTLLKKPLTASFVKYTGSRPYVDISYLLSSKFVSKQFAKAFSGNDIPLQDVMLHVINKHGKTFTNQGIRFKIPWGIIKYSFKMLK